MIIAVRVRDADIRDDQGMYQAPAAATPTPGLAVAELPPLPSIGADRFPVIHVRSGISVGNYPHEELAVAAAIEYGEIGVDWTRSGHDIDYATRKPVVLNALRAIGRRYHRSAPVATPTNAELQDMPS